MITRRLFVFVIVALLLVACGGAEAPAATIEATAKTTTPPFVASTAPAPTAPPERALAVLGTWAPESSTPAVAIAGQLGYLAHGAVLYTLDLTVNPFTVVASMSLPAVAQQVAMLTTTTVVVATADNTLAMIDLQDPQTPLVLHTANIAAGEVLVGSTAVLVGTGSALALLSQTDLSELGPNCICITIAGSRPGQINLGITDNSCSQTT